MEKDKRSRVVEEVKGLFWALLVAIFIRTFLFQPFNIPSSSMYPTLLVGDFLFVSKYTYGFSRYSLPFMPNLFSGRIWDGDPQLGDVIVFTAPHKTSEDWIKRLVGKPGDKVQMIKGVLHINGEAVKLEKIEDYQMTEEDEQTKTKKTVFIPQYIETLPNGVKHRILKAAPFGEGSLDNTPEYLVPSGQYFFMGDNRDNSGDSRVMSKLGFVPKEYLLGPARLIFFSTEAKWYQPTDYIHGLRPSRFFNLIR